MQVYLIDLEGYYIRPIVITDESIPVGCTPVEPPKGLYKPKFVNGEWVEGATQEYIDSIANAPRELTEIDKLRLEQAQANSELVQLIMMMGGV